MGHLSTLLADVRKRAYKARDAVQPIWRYTKMSTTYAVIEADGFFRDEAMVCEVYADKTRAINSTRHDRRWQVIQGDGLEIGQKIHRTSIGQIYPVVEGC